MTSVNLFEIGKAFYARSHRDPSHEGKAKALSLANEMWQAKKTKEELLEIIAQLKPIERTFPRIWVFYADIAEQAIRRGKYVVDIPHEIAHRYNDRPGRVYILTSSSRRGQCKLGATTMTIPSRCISTRLSDILRRAEHWNEAIQLATVTLGEAPDGPIRDVLAFEIAASQKSDAGCYRIADVIKPNAAGA